MGLLDGPKVVVGGVVHPRPKVNPHRVRLYLIVSQVEGSVIEEGIWLRQVRSLALLQEIRFLRL